MQAKSRNDVGATWLITVPETYTDEEIEKMIDTAMNLPANVVGSVMVVRDGTRVDTFRPESGVERDS